MKKLLVLVVVLAVVACANAGIVTNVAGSLYGFVEVSEGVVNIVALQAKPNAIIFQLGSDDGVITMGTISTAGAGATTIEGGTGTYASEFTGQIGAYGDLAVNDVLIAGTSLTAGSMKLFSAAEVDGDYVFTELASYSVPEPVTVALLGLGGLFIRRRKVA